MQASDLKTGVIFQENNQPYKVEKYDHIKVARGGAHVKIKARNLKAGNLTQKSYLSSDKVEDASTLKKSMQFLYKDKGSYIFMDPSSYNQVSISEDIVGNQAKFIGEGIEVIVLYFEDSPISIELPKTVEFKVKYTEPAQKGNTVTNAFKDAKLTNNTVVKVPLFINIGDKIKINTDTEEYVSRV